MELFVSPYLREQVSKSMVRHKENIIDMYRTILQSVRILGRRSENSLYNQELVSMDLQGGYDPVDAGGFIRAHAVRLKEYYRVKTEQIVK